MSAAATSGQLVQPRPAHAPRALPALRLLARRRRPPAAVVSLLAPLARGEASRISRRARTSAWGVVPYELWLTPAGVAWRPRGSELERVAPVQRIASADELGADEALAVVAWHEIAEARLGRAADGLERLDLLLRDGTALAVVWETREAGRAALPAGRALAEALAERCPGALASR